MNYAGLPYHIKGLFLTITAIILFLFLYLMVRNIGLKRKKGTILLSAFFVFLTYGIQEALSMQLSGDMNIDFPFPILILVLVSLVVIFFIGHRRLLKWQNSHISALSIKEALDKVPTGICYCVSGGIPIMTNNAMNKISTDLYGRQFYDGNAFWDMLGRYEDPNVIRSGERPIIMSPSGRIYSFKRNVLDFRGNKVTEITAVDVTREYDLTRQLEDHRNKAKSINNRLKALLETIEYVTMNREMLQLKSALHDNIGQSILIAKRYLLVPGSVDRNEMLTFWKTNICHLLNETPEEWELPYYVISKEAVNLGIELQIVGDLPTERNLIPAVDSAISVQVGNTLRHADGKKVFINIEAQGSEYVLTFKNDGRQPEGKVTERGGLKNLRLEIEAVGGSMRIESVPEFVLEIKLPKGGNEDAL